MKDLYEVLGVTRSASQAEIKHAYRKLAKELHPDLNPGQTTVADLFKEVAAAYTMLNDAERRAQYDRGRIRGTGTRRCPGAEPATAGRRFGFEPSAFGAAAAEDLFSGLFSGLGPTRKASFKAQGADHSYKLRVSFIDAALGAKRRLVLRNGRAVEVAIPAGIRDGQSIRLKDRGDPGFGGAAPGDALVRVSTEPHPYFGREGNDIRLEVPVTLREAVLGARIRVPTVAGPVSMRVPKGSNTARVLRLQGKGIKDAATGALGDQYVMLKVVLPDKTDAELARLMAQWTPQDPRGSGPSRHQHLQAHNGPCGAGAV